MKLVSVAQMRELDRRTIEEFETPADVLMDRAGQGVAEAVRFLSDVCETRDPAIVMLAGRGNNGGDVFAAACHLREDDYDIEIWLACSESDLRGDALKHFNKMKEAGIPVVELPTKDDWDDMSGQDGGDILVDGLLGTGVKGPPRGPAAAAIHFINSQIDRSLVLAVDIPSGLDADTGEPAGEAVHADMTVTMGLPKRGLAMPAAADYVGTLEVYNIGIPAEYVAEVESGERLLTGDDVAAFFHRRHRASHKGSFGHVLLIGGSSRYTGAMIMAGRAAVRSGAGLVTAIVPRSLHAIMAAAIPEIMVCGERETEHGVLSADLAERWRGRWSEFDAVLVGPGMTTDAQTAAIVEHLLRDCGVPLVCDADALNVLQGRIDALGGRAHPLVITPHPGEMARLMGRSTGDVQADRLGTAIAAAEKASGATVILKGAGTIVAQAGQLPWINSTGNPGMASGGMGDVLAGLLTGLLAQGLSPFDAARAAVYLHGHAADSAAWRMSQAGVIASDVIDELAYSFRAVMVR